MTTRSWSLLNLHQRRVLRVKPGFGRARKKFIQGCRTGLHPVVALEWRIFRALRGRDGWEPDFFIIGPPRCGTTWLKRHLALHPNILMADGEPEYFSNKFHRGPLWYRNRMRQVLFPEAKSGAKILRVGEKSARYCGLPVPMIRFVDRLYPDARYFLMSRAPAERAWSHAKMHFRRRQLALTEDRVKKFALTYASRYDHAAAKQRWRQVVGDRLVVLSLEEIASDPTGQYRRALRHLGLDPEIPENVQESLLDYQRRKAGAPKAPEYLVELLGGPAA